MGMRRVWPGTSTIGKLSGLSLVRDVVEKRTLGNELRCSVDAGASVDDGSSTEFEALYDASNSIELIVSDCWRLFRNASTVSTEEQGFGTRRSGSDCTLGRSKLDKEIQAGIAEVGMEVAVKDNPLDNPVLGIL
jgi:hypothetical protein